MHQVTPDEFRVLQGDGPARTAGPFPMAENFDKVNKKKLQKSRWTGKKMKYRVVEFENLRNINIAVLGLCLLLCVVTQQYSINQKTATFILRKNEKIWKK